MDASHTMTNFFTRKAVRLFFNWFYKVKPPEMVNIWGSAARRAKRIETDAGHYALEIEGEKYPMAGYPRAHVLFGPLAKAKHSLKNMIFNQVFAEMAKIVGEAKYDMMPEDQMVPAVKELNRVLKDLENAEIVDDMKKRIALIRTVITFFLQEDDAYRNRFQWVAERLDVKKIRLSESDKYFFRGKYFKVDHGKYDY